MRNFYVRSRIAGIVLPNFSTSSLPEWTTRKPGLTSVSDGDSFLLLVLSPLGIMIANQNRSLPEDFRRRNWSALPADGRACEEVLTQFAKAGIDIDALVGQL